MSTGFIMTTQTIRIRHPHGVRTSGRPACARPAPAGRAPLPTVPVAAAPASPRSASCSVVPIGAR
ncbi:hypothetical protein C6T61_23510 [Burkholderia multivorans]|nr:hypothetical protein C6T61_23510 [Burkholderia multivorans]